MRAKPKLDQNGQGDVEDGENSEKWQVIKICRHL